MSGPPDPDHATDRDRALTLAHRAALAVLAACAAIIAAFDESATGASPPAAFPLAAFGLGVSAIGFRQAASGPARSAGARLRLAAIAYACAAAIGVVGIALVALAGQRQSALLYAMGGAILALRPPASVTAQGR